jgi:ActR/RegA family two-component response regulator
MGAERRQFLRVLFEETIEVRTAEWTDPVATGLDISLNGVRFHCEHSLSDGETVTISFTPDFELIGKVRWCWPIEWYYQSAVQFVEITPDEQESLRDYITSATGEEYPLSEEEEARPAAGEAETTSGEYLELEQPQAGALSVEFAEEDLTPMSFSGRLVLIMSEQEGPATSLRNYLLERCGLETEVMSKKQSLWRMMKLDPIDVVVMAWDPGNPEESLNAMRQTYEQFPETRVLFLAPPTPLETRLHAINQGAVDFVTQPVSLSTVAQAVLRCMLSEPQGASGGGDGGAMGVAAAGGAVLAEEEPMFGESEDFEDDFNLDDEDFGDELELIDEDF